MKREEPLTYGAYLRVPEMLALQTPLSRPPVHDEMLFIVLQQAQELWFKQILYELRAVIERLRAEECLAAVRLLGRVNAIVRVLSEEVEVMETITPIQFQLFRHLLTPSSGFESEQFRELELASGLHDAAFLKMVGKLIDLEDFEREWPMTLYDAFGAAFATLDSDVVTAVIRVYEAPGQYPEMYALAEALSEYELRFGEWRFHHIQLVERVIGDQAAGTAGSSGSTYLSRTLHYRFFPELWEARNQITLNAGHYQALHERRREPGPV